MSGVARLWLGHVAMKSPPPHRGTTQAFTASNSKSFMNQDIHCLNPTRTPLTSRQTLGITCTWLSGNTYCTLSSTMIWQKTSPYLWKDAVGIAANMFETPMKRFETPFKYLSQLHYFPLSGSVQEDTKHVREETNISQRSSISHAQIWRDTGTWGSSGPPPRRLYNKLYIYSLLSSHHSQGIIANRSIWQFLLVVAKSRVLQTITSLYVNLLGKCVIACT